MTKAFPKSSLNAFGEAYPEAPLKLEHNLSGHPLFSLDALAALAQRMRPEDVEYNRGDLPIGVDPNDALANGLGIVETIRSIEENESWMVMKFVEQDPIYSKLLDETLAELDPVVGPATGRMLKKEAFIFVSSPDAVTPFHFDPEHNILLQIRGNKVMTVFPAGDEEIAAAELHERFHMGGHRNLPWRDDFERRGRPFPLAPGEAIYVPVKAPHWVKNGPAPSVSFSITWRSEWSFREEDAHGLNHILRKAGIEPASPHRYPRQNQVKSLAYRTIRKARNVVRGGD